MKMFIGTQPKKWCSFAFLLLIGAVNVSAAEETPALEAPKGTAAEVPVAETPAPPLAAPVAQDVEPSHKLSLPSNQEIFLDRIQGLEQRLGNLGQDINTSRATLKLLKEQVTGNFDADARISIVSRNDVGDRFVLVESIYFVDGKQVVKVDGESPKKPTVFDDFIGEGKHEVSVEKLYRGNSTLFPYFKDYTFLLKGATTIETRAGQTTFVDVVSYQKGITSDIKDGLDVKFDAKMVANSKDGRALLSVLDMPEKLAANSTIDPYLVIGVKDQMGSQFALVNQRVFVDGQLVSSAAPTVVVSNGQILFQGPVAPGEHNVNASLEFQGDSKLFTYFKGYKFTLKFSKKIVVRPGYKTTVNLIGFKKPGWWVPADKKPQAKTEVIEEAYSVNVVNKDNAIEKANIGGERAPL